MALLPNLLAYYNCDEQVDGEDLLDSHSNGFDLAAQDGGTPSTDTGGIIGRSRILQRGGLADNHFTRADTGIADPFRFSVLFAAGFSVNAWVQIDTKSATTFQTIASKQAMGAGNTEWFLRYDTTTDRPEFGVANTAPAAFIAEGTASIDGATPGTFTMLTGVFDGVTQDVILYVDGVEDARNTLWTGTAAGSTGEFAVGGEATLDLYWDGFLDEISIYNGTITPTDVEDLFASGSALAYPLAQSGVIPAGRGRFSPRRRATYFFFDEEGNQVQSSGDNFNFIGGDVQ